MSMIQKLVAKAVAERGYREGWTVEQYAARQICKATEELGELAEGVGWSCLWHLSWVESLSEASEDAAHAFDYPDFWEYVQSIDRNTLAQELPDVVIPLFVLAEEYGLDLLELAREKVTADVARGVRGEVSDGNSD